MFASTSLRARLSIAVLVVLLILGVAIAVGANLLFDRMLGSISENQVDQATERLLAAIRPGTTGPELDLTRIDATYRRPLSGQYYVIVTDGQRWRSRSLWDRELAVPDIPGEYQRLSGPAGQRLLAVTRQYQRYGQSFAISAAYDYSPLVTEFRNGLYLFLALWTLAVVVTITVLQLWTGAALKPLARAREQVASVQRGQRQHLDEEVPDELAPLVRQINALLAETRQALTRSRQSLSNLGHALKTPVAVLSALVEREELRVHPHLQRGLREQVDLIGRRIDRELGRSAGPSAGGVRVPFNPELEIPRLADALERAHGRALAVDWRLPDDAQFRVERDDMLEIAGNLLDNAWKWAASRIRVAVERQAGRWVLVVEDDGPGIPDPDRRREVLDRGVRLDENTAGQGLGLAIAADIIAAYRGTLELDDSSLGGLRARVVLPDMGAEPGSC